MRVKKRSNTILTNFNIEYKKKLRSFILNEKNNNINSQTFIKNKFDENKFYIDNMEDIINNNKSFKLKEKIKKSDILKKCSCGGEFLVNDNKGSLICQECGEEINNIIYDHSREEFDYDTNKVYASTYERKKNFQKLLEQIQGLNCPKISDKTLLNIIKELNSNGFIYIDQIDKDIILKTLKKMKIKDYTKIYVNVMRRINYKDIPKLSKGMIDNLENMFDTLQKYWEKNSPNSRTNFLNYPYVIYKLSELLEYNNFLKFISLPKANKLKEYDKLWIKVCQDLGWTFKRTY